MSRESAPSFRSIRRRMIVRQKIGELLLWWLGVTLFVLTLYASLYWVLSLMSGERLCIQSIAGHLRKILSDGPILVAVITGLVGLSVEWWRRSAEEEEKTRANRRQEALQELEQLSESLRQKHYSDALSLYHTFWERCQKGGTWQDIDVWEDILSIWQHKAPSPLQRWTELLSEKPNLELDFTTLEALTWGQRLDPRNWEEKGKKIIAQLIIPDKLEDLVKLFAREPEIRKSLLRSEIIGQRLEELHQSVSETQRQHLDTLLKWRKLPPVGIPLPWEKIDRPPDPQQFAEWLKLQGFQINPFGPEMAELDPWLSEYGHWPSALEFARGPRPALVLGPPGSGRTAAALLLYQKCLWPPGNPEEEGVFPVWLRLNSWPQSTENWLEEIGRALTEALIQVCGKDPYALFPNPETSATVSHLFVHYFGPAGQVESHLRRHGLNGSTVEYVLSACATCSGSGQANIPWDVISKARPANLKATYVLLDIPTLWSEESDLCLKSLGLLIERTGVLASQSVYLKLFLPQAAAHPLATHWPLQTIFLEWSEEDLKSMLYKRLTQSSAGYVESLQLLLSAEEYPPDPDTWLVRSAEGSPRRLVDLGNQMLRKAWRGS